jgi:hypothetical protein
LFDERAGKKWTKVEKKISKGCGKRGKMRNRLIRGLFAAALVTGLFSRGATGQEAAGKVPRDGQHDFDFELGS